MVARHMVVMLRRTILVVGRITRCIAVVVSSRLLGAVHLGSHFAWIFANNFDVKSDEDSNKQNPWQEITHDKVQIAEESAATSKISEDTCPVTSATGQFRASVPVGRAG